MRSYYRLIVCIVIGWSLLGVASACTVAPQDESYVGWLQKMRGRITGAEGAYKRVDCALKLIPQIDQSDLNKTCHACSSEYFGILRDSASFARQVATPSRNRDTKAAYFGHEIFFRTILIEFLKSETGRAFDPSGEKLRKNFKEIADTFALAERGQDFHQLFISQPSTLKFDVAVYALWAKAVRSCNEWDFKSGVNRGVTGEKLVNALCGENCSRALERVEKRLLVIDEDARSTVRDSIPEGLCAGDNL